MDLATALQVISAITLIVGVLFGLAQLRQSEARRRRESALELVHSFDTPEFSRGWRLLLALRSPPSVEEFQAFPREDADALMQLMSTGESLGILVYRHEVDLDLVDDFFSSGILLTWQKLGPYIEELREEQGRETLGEWIQWLAERMSERETGQPPVPAYVAHRGWRPKR